MTTDEASASVADPMQEKMQESLEAVLSKKNLVRDQFLAGNMNPQMYIPITILLQHEKLLEIGATAEAVIIAATNSTRLGIDESKTMVRPMLKSKRNVVIIRDLVQGATEDEVRNIFAGSPYSEKVSSIKAEVNNTWFVKFDLDDGGSAEVVLWLRSQKFKGQSINAAIKSEHFLRSFVPVDMAPAPPPDAINPYSFAGNMGQFGDMKGAGKGMMHMPPMPMQMQMPSSQQPPGFWQSWGARTQPEAIVLPLTGPEVVPVTDREGKGKDANSWSWDKGGKGRGKDSQGKGKGKDNKGKHSKGAYDTADRGRAGQKKTRDEGGKRETDVSGPMQPKLRPPATYSREYQKYDRAQFEEIAKKVASEPLSKAESIMQLEDDTPIFRDSACLDLA
mmetsp:Transcript_377/g.543  ORF Transcript_377/g.543 Transcript_377/m.543 type:complete len:391 (-) Transcript_377:84-1256(-)